MNRLMKLFSGRGTAEDPVCHMRVGTSTIQEHIYEYAGQLYYFCGPGCRVAFSKEPEVYLSGEKKVEM